MASSPHSTWPPRRPHHDRPRLTLIAAALEATAVIYGTDVFAAAVLRPALAHVDDRTLTGTTGYLHDYADRRLPVPGAIGLAAATRALRRQWDRVIDAAHAVHQGAGPYSTPAADPNDHDRVAGYRDGRSAPRPDLSPLDTALEHISTAPPESSNLA